MLSVASNADQTLVLKFDDVWADRLPGVVWEVYAGLPAGKEPDTESPFFLGTLSIFSTGVRMQGHESKAAEFSFTLDRAVTEALRTDSGKLEITLVPSGILINGKRSEPKVQGRVRINRVSIAIENQRKR